MFMIMNPPLRRNGKRSPKHRPARKNGGGKSRLAKLLAQFRARSAKRSKSTSFRGMALNRGSARPLTCRLSSAPFTGVHMKRRRGGRRVRNNAGSLVKSISAGLKPSAWMEVIPYAGGAVVTELATMFGSKWIPMTAGGLGNILLSGAMAGITGTLGGALLKNRTIGSKMILGGVAGVVGKTITNFRSHGFGGTFGLHGMGNEMFHSNFSSSFMGDFTSPPQITNAVQSGMTAAQYSLPNANAQYVPMAPQMQAPGGAHAMADYELGAVGDMLDQHMGGY